MNNQKRADDIPPSSLLHKDFTPNGQRLEGAYENDRNAVYSELYKDIIREAYGVQDVICAHHLVFVTSELRSDGFEYQIVQEVPSADSLIFNHDVASKIWPENWKWILTELALTPVAQRDKKLHELFYSRSPKSKRCTYCGSEH